MNPSRHKMTVLAQICKLIPGHMVNKLAAKHGVEEQARTFSPWSHVVSLLFTQTSHAMGLNDVCDTLQNHKGVLTTIRRATAPSRNGLSNANRTRKPEMAEDLFWEMLKHLEGISEGFGMARKYCSLPKRFRKTISTMDSSTIKLFANCLDWAKHRRRKAAAKMHLRLNLQEFLPKMIIVKTAGTHDSAEAKELCADVKAGEIVVFDKAYIDYKHLYSMNTRGIFWVSRSKTNMKYKSVGQHKGSMGKIIRDEIIELTCPNVGKKYPEKLRLVEAWVKIEGKEKRMTFITNNFEWAASSVSDLYKARWGIEVFFKELKQTLQLADFLGYNENAVKWQVWTALLVYLLLRFIAFQSKWGHSFFRLFTVLRGVLWSCLDMFSVLESYGTAGAVVRLRAVPEQGYLPGFAPI